jgi:hypothetical protein
MKTPWASIAKIEADGAHSGTGFLVGGKLVLTALHVVADKATGRPFPNLVLRFDTNAEYADGSQMFETRARLAEELWDTGLDFALLECDTAPPGRPLSLVNCCGQNENCLCPGFAVQRLAGFTATGHIASLNDPMPGGLAAIGIQFDFGSGVYMKGHSGSAVFVGSRVAGFLRTAFVDENERTMGGIVHATPLRDVVACCDRVKPGLLSFRPPIEWPEPGPAHVRILADRRAEFEIFEKMITGRSRERILLLSGESGSGKTLLTEKLIQYAKSLGVPVASADCKGTPDLDRIFNKLLSGLGPGILPQAETATGYARIWRLLDDLAELKRPVLIALDTWESSTDETLEMIEKVLQAIPGTPAAVVVIGGQAVPDCASGNWAGLAVPRHLEPIDSSEDWIEYARGKFPAVHFSEDHVEGITLAARGRPNLIDILLDGLHDSTRAFATSGGQP